MYTPHDFLDSNGYPLAPEEIAELLNATTEVNEAMIDIIHNMVHNALQVGQYPNYVLVGKTTYKKLQKQLPYPGGERSLH